MAEQKTPTRFPSTLVIAILVSVVTGALVSVAFMPFHISSNCSGSSPLEGLCDLEFSEAAWLGVTRAGLPAGALSAAGLLAMYLLIRLLGRRPIITFWWSLLGGLMAVGASLLLCFLFVAAATVLSRG
jgi:hypothetical protein